MVKEGKLLQIFCMVLCVILISNCKKTQLAQKPNVLLICVDDLRPELKSFGAKYISSPNIDEFAKKGVSFLKTFCECTELWPVSLYFINRFVRTFK